MKIVLLCLSIVLTLPVKSQETGIELYSFRNQFPKDVLGTLDKIRSFGITAVEGGESYGMPISEFQAALKERNIKVVSIGFYISFSQLVSFGSFLTTFKMK